MSFATRTAFLLAGVLTAGIPARGAQNSLGDDPWRLVHPQAKWIFGADWARARTSLAAQVLTRQFEGARSAVQASGLGLSAVVSLDRIIVSGAALETGGGGNPAPFVAALQGKIDRARLKKELPPGTAVERFKGADLFVPPRAAPDEPLVAAVSDRLLLMGDRRSLGLVLDGKGGVRDPELFGRATRLALEADIWLTAAAPASAGSPVQGLEQVELSVSLQEGLRLAGALKADSEQSAQGLAGFAQLAGAMNGGAAEWLRRMKIELRGREVSFALDIPAAELQQGIEQAKSAVQETGRQMVEALLAGQNGSLPESLRPAVKADGATLHLGAAPPPSQPKVRTIRIVGAEDGTKEIQYSTPGRPGN